MKPVAMNDNRVSARMTRAVTLPRGHSTPILFHSPFVAFRLGPNLPALDIHMELWTEYEGKTIDGAFPLKKLLAPEGRSAFFSTSNGNGDPVLIRLIESHFDADEILARWQGVQALGHPNLLRLDQYSQVPMDGTTVIYAVMEPVEANLAAVVSGQRLTVQETIQLATSVSSALDVLHTHGFVHEHIEPANIFAVGDVVKLRSDCIREAPEGEKGAQSKRRDIHDLGIVLLQALTQEHSLAAATNQLPLPSPFDHIVRKSVSGEWGIAEIRAALQTQKRPAAPLAAPVSNPQRIAVEAPPVAATKPVITAKAAEPESETSVDARSRDRYRVPAGDGARKTGLRNGSIIAAALAVILIVWLSWHFAHRGSQNGKAAIQPNAKPAHAPAPVAPPPISKPDPSTGPGHQAAQNTEVATSHSQWRVVAYTYNHADQAQKKSATVAQQHPELRPEVFTPTGHAPYLVTVGGSMNRDDALAFAQKARSLGLPRDTYAQNYSSKQR